MMDIYMCNCKWRECNGINKQKKYTSASTYNRGPLSDENSQWKTKIWWQDNSVLGWNSDDVMKREKMSSFVKTLAEFCMKKRNNKLHNLQTYSIIQWHFYITNLSIWTVVTNSWCKENTLSLPSVVSCCIKKSSLQCFDTDVNVNRKVI